MKAITSKRKNTSTRVDRAIFWSQPQFSFREPRPVNGVHSTPSIWTVKK